MSIVYSHSFSRQITQQVLLYASQEQTVLWVWKKIKKQDLRGDDIACDANVSFAVENMGTRGYHPWVSLFFRLPINLNLWVSSVFCLLLRGFRPSYNVAGRVSEEV